MKIRRKDNRVTIGSQRVGVVFRFTGGVYGIYDGEVCMKLALKTPAARVESVTGPCRIVSLVSGKQYIVGAHFRIQELVVELHVLGDLL